MENAKCPYCGGIHLPEHVLVDNPAFIREVVDEGEDVDGPFYVTDCYAVRHVPGNVDVIIYRRIADWSDRS